MLARMSPSAEVVTHALTYLRCRALACPALFGLFVCTGTFRGFQDTKCADCVVLRTQGLCFHGYSHQVRCRVPRSLAICDWDFAWSLPIALKMYRQCNVCQHGPRSRVS